MMLTPTDTLRLSRAMRGVPRRERLLWFLTALMLWTAVNVHQGLRRLEALEAAVFKKSPQTAQR